VRTQPIITGRSAITYWALVPLWIVGNLLFWSWWLRPAHVENPWLFALFSLAFGYDVTILPSAYIFLVGRMRRPQELAAPPGLRVALITLCVPSAESLEVIARQLRALRAVRYPHESWVLDEGNDPEVRAAARRLGVRYFTRAGIARYNQPHPPFKAKTKAGNVNAWLDAHGHEYDFFVQFDIDHRPRPDYLDRVLGYFQDPRVAWVQAPSIYGNRENWVARGAAEQELVLQGPLQQGFFGLSQTPFIIGSHCTYRMSAVREIGGFQPTRAEDHLDTVVLASRGYRGVFVPEVIALGNGPEDFETYLRQQFAWAYSLIEVLFRYTPRFVWRFRPVQALQFLFVQTWYPFWSTSMLALFVMPLIVLITGTRPSNVAFLPFWLAFAPVGITSTAFWWWTRRWQLPRGLSLSWRGVILHVARWPIVFWALINVLVRVKHPYMITPKGERASIPAIPFRSQVLYLAATWLSLLTVLVYLERGLAEDVQGYVLFVLWGVLFMAAVVAATVITDFVGLRQRGLRLATRLRLRLLPLAMLTATLGLMGFTTAASSQRIVSATLWLEQSATHVDFSSAAPPREALSAAPTPLAEVASTPVATPATPLSAAAPVPAPDLPEGRVVIGAYDPRGILAGVPYTVEHWYVEQDQPERLAEVLRLVPEERIVLVTVQPFRSADGTTPVLQSIVQGDLDAQLRQIAAVVGASRRGELWLRWGHEMDLTGLYPWCVDDPALYRAAYRRVVSVVRAEGLTGVRWVWSPAGNTGAEAFYPGDDVVDLVGMTVLGDEGWDRQFGQPPRSFEELTRPRYQLLERFGKPLIIAELGVSGTAERQERWLAEAVPALDRFPLLRAIVYFNDRNTPNNWLASQPDWTLSAAQFERFARAVDERVTLPMEQVGG